MAKDGALYLNPAVVMALGIGAGYIEAERERQLTRLRERRRALSRPPADPAGRNAIVVDDGIATGATLRLALRWVKARGPRYLVAAVPVGAPESCAQLEPLADEVICLETPSHFLAIGQFYERFEQVSDEEVAAALAPKRRPE